MKKIVIYLSLIVIICFIATGCDLNETEPSTNETTTQVTEKSEDNYMDTLRKCTVMEAADLYTTGGSKTGENVFDTAKEQCESWYKQWGEEEFFKAVNSDWENRKDEQIEGNPLTHYLDVLGW